MIKLNSKQYKKKNRGATSIIITILLLGTLFIIGFGVSVLMINQLQATARLGDAVIVIYAADAGAEKCLYQVRKSTGEGCDVPGGGIISEDLDASRGITYTAQYNGVDTINSIGEYKESSRSFELTF